MMQSAPEAQEPPCSLGAQSRKNLNVSVRGFQLIVADRATHGDSRMNRRSPAFQAMMPGAMKQVGDADGSRRSRHLDSGKKRIVVDDGVGQESFIDAAASKIES